MEHKKDIVQYWLTTAENDHETMDVLYKNGRYSHALFFGHIVLEKILKALVVQNTGEHAPFTHDLVQLQKVAGMILSEGEDDLLDEINDFNIRARYPEFRFEFYKKCTKEFTEKYIVQIESLYKKYKKSCHAIT